MGAVWLYALCHATCATRESAADPRRTQLISFIVPAYNEARLIGGTLDSIHAAGHAAGHAVDEPCEIIVADDGSSDDTATIARLRGARVVTVKHQKIGATRNSGAATAHGDLLIFVDADTLVTAAVVKAAVDAVRAGAIGGSAKARFDGQVPR